MRNNPSIPNRKLLNVPVVALLTAGIIHLLIAPAHMNHAAAHGIFFGFTGLMQIGWAFEFRAGPTRRMLQVGIALSAGLILLWALTRLLGAPFARALDPIDWSVVASKLAEAIGAAALSVMAWRGAFADRDGSANGPTRARFARRALAKGLGMALALGLALYGGARLVEPFLPGLASLAEGPGHTHGGSSAAPLNAAWGGGMLVTGAWISPPASPDGNAALYFSITNLSGRDDVLGSVRVDAAERAQIARTVTVAGDVSQTTLVDALDVPQTGPLILAPGGDAVLLVGLSGDLAPGQIVPVSLVFQGAGRVDVSAEVVVLAPPAQGP